MIEIIPAIDIVDGKCVRLKLGDFSQKKIYSKNPLQVAKDFEKHGLKRLHIVDLDGAKSGTVSNLAVLEKIAANTNLDIDFGGGIKTDDDLKSVFDSGAKLANIGSVAVTTPKLFETWLDKYGGEKILLGADVKNNKIAIHGWQETTELDLLPFLAANSAKGVEQVFVTDVSKDGLLEGSAKQLYKNILVNMPDLNLIASGGVDSFAEIDELEKIGCRGVIIGKAIYEGRISLDQIGNRQSGKNGGI